MTKFELVKSAIAHSLNEKTPYAINLAGDAIKEYGDKILQDYATKQILDDLENKKIGYNDALSLAMGNCVINLDCPWWGWHNLSQQYSEYDAPEKLPDTMGYGSYESFFGKIKYIKQNYDVYTLVTIWGSHWEKAYFARGIENFLADIAGEPEFAQDLLDMIIRKNMVMLENILPGEDIDGVLLGSDWGTQRDLIMSPIAWRGMIKHGEQVQYDLIKKYNKDLFIHSCGNVKEILPDLCEMGVDVLNPIQPECMDIYSLKRDFGDKLTFWGGISTQQTLPNGTAKQVIDETTHVIQSLSINGGYITSPSQEIQADVPYENLVALIETAKKHCI